MFGSRVELKAVAQGRPFQNDDASFSDMTADSFLCPVPANSAAGNQSAIWTIDPATRQLRRK